MSKMASRPLQVALRETRIVLGVSGKDFADLLGVAPRTVSRWEVGRATPSGPLREHIVERVAPMLDDASRGRLIAALGLEPAVQGDGATTVSASAGGARPLLDAAIREAAERLDVSARQLREALDPILAQIARSGLSASDARRLVRPSSP